jgi:predicted lipoprotein with Yx(FWY)xxD motif
MEAWTPLYIAEDNKVADGSVDSIIYCIRQQGQRQKSDKGSRLYTLLHEARIRRELIL